MQQWPAAFFNGKFQQTTNTNPQKISFAFFGFHSAKESRSFFAQAFRPNLCHVATPSFFLRTNLRRGPSGKTFLQGVIWRRKWHCKKHSMAVYLRKAFFYSYWKGTTKKCKTHPFPLGCLVDIGSEKFPQWILGIICFILAILSDPVRSTTEGPFLAHATNTLFNGAWQPANRQTAGSIGSRIFNLQLSLQPPKRLRGFVILLMKEIPNNHLFHAWNPANTGDIYHINWCDHFFHQQYVPGFTPQQVDEKPIISRPLKVRA